MNYKFRLRYWCWRVCRFFAWDQKATMYYRATGSYRGLPRSWEVAVNITNSLGRGSSLFRALREMNGRWVIR